MHLRKIVRGLLIFPTVPTAWATPSIDFVNQEGSMKTYDRVDCTAQHSDGQIITAQGRQDSGASVVKLQDLLAGASGLYRIQCTAVRAKGNESYSAEFDAVKFPEGEPGSQAPEYDEHRFGYGIRTPARSTRTACYDPARRVSREECLIPYYGSQPFYLESSDSTEDVRYKYRKAYSSNVGVFLNVNPRYKNPN